MSLGFTIFYLSIIVIIPLTGVFIKTSGLSWERFWHTVTNARVVASYRISFVTAFAAAVVNLVFGLIIAWVLVRYRFPGKKLVDSLVDLPFALPTAVAGIALTAIYAPNGWIGIEARAARHQGRLHTARYYDRTYFYRITFCRTYRAACITGLRQGYRGSGCYAWCLPLAYIPQNRASRAHTAVVNGLCLVFCQRNRRVRLGRLHLR